MIFRYIKLVNFRQYRNSHEIAFSTDEDKRMTLIIAGNGVGKTTLLQAFRFCFYGSSSNYLNLPRADELLNYNIVKELNETDTALLAVEVGFTHQNVQYIVRREQLYRKKKNKMDKVSGEKFSLREEVPNKGFVPYLNETAFDKMWQILPPGLSHIFMFDGERMENSIESKSYKNELKEAVLGILEIKKIDKLIELIGRRDGLNTTLLNSLVSKRTSTSKEEQDEQNRLAEYNSKVNKFIEEIDGLQDKVNEIADKIKSNEAQQEAKVKSDKLLMDIKIHNEGISNCNEQMKILANDYIKTSHNAILFKLLLTVKPKYDKFIASKEKGNFYQYLHVDTLSEILEREKCLCGNEVKKGTPAYENIKSLFETALPNENAHHLTQISSLFNGAFSFEENYEKLKKIKEKITEQKAKRMEHSRKLTVASKKQKELEKTFGVNFQLEIEKLKNSEKKLNEEITKKTTFKEIWEKKVFSQQKIVENINSKSEYNSKINEVIGNIKKVRDQLILEKENLDRKARGMLSKNFNETLTSVIRGFYDVSINDKYKLNILEIDEDDVKVDVTDKLSTGQSVVVSLSFIKALIATSKELSKKVDKSEKYGVIMDAALSNVDENHINRVCAKILAPMEQIIFLSFARQLRNEMYDGIIDNVGKAYIFEINSGEVNKKEVKRDELYDLIHYSEEKNNGFNT